MHIDVNGARISVTDAGGGAPVVLVHGFPFSGAMWDPVRERLLRAGRRVIVPDLRGFGASEGPPSLGIAAYADDLLALLDALGLREPVAWAGFSMGGYVTLDVCRRRPERVRALALVDTRAGADDAAARAGRLATAEKVAADGSSAVADAMGPKLFAAATPTPLRSAVHRAMSGAASVGVIAALHAMGSRPDSTSVLPTIRVPTVVVVGAEDRITPPADSEALAKAIPGARVRVVADAGHLSPLEQPERVAAAILEVC